ncbi:MAG: Bor/Iss family lipoprotein, partial [Fusobacteriaceae bacterium]
LFVSSCASQSFSFTKNKVAIEKAKLSDWNQFVLGGIGQSNDVDVIAVCGSAAKVQKVEFNKTFGNVIISIMTLFIYTPTTYKVYCSK